MKCLNIFSRKFYHMCLWVCVTVLHGLIKIFFRINMCSIIKVAINLLISKYGTRECNSFPFKSRTEWYGKKSSAEFFFGFILLCRSFSVSLHGKLLRFICIGLESRFVWMEKSLCNSFICSVVEKWFKFRYVLPVNAILLRCDHTANTYFGTAVT